LKPIEKWSRDELVSGVETLLKIGNVAFSLVVYVQDGGADHDVLMQHVEHLAGAFFLSKPLPERS
jgi:hypothetical protein